jgi:putative ABC transport system permease protein
MNFLIGLVTFVAVIIGVVVFLGLPWPGMLVLLVLLALWMVLTRRGQQAWSVDRVGVSTLRSGSVPPR